MKRSLFLLPVLLFLLACGARSEQKRSPAGNWAMGPLTEPTSSAPEKFSADEWAASLPSGGLLTLTPDGGAIGVEGGWKENDIRLSWTSESARGIVSSTEIQGRYDPGSDTIQAELIQNFQIGPIPLTLRGKTIMTRVTP